MGEEVTELQMIKEIGSKKALRIEQWRDKYGHQYSLSEYPYKYYDYNF